MLRLLLPCLLLVACAAPGDPAPPEGELSVINYNVWGLPDALTGSDPAGRMVQIGPRLDAFDIALVQEDFYYQSELSGSVELPHRSVPGEVLKGDQTADGLSRFSQSPFTDHARVAWPGCNGALDCGSDCLANKGYSFARHELADGVELDVYNLHNEAGRCDEDFTVRMQSTEAMLADMRVRSEGRAVVAVGDFNLLLGDAIDEDALDLWSAEYRDLCAELACPEEEHRGRRERTYLRDGDTVSLTSVEHRLDEDGFEDEEGEPLSNHPPQRVRVGWVAAP